MLKMPLAALALAASTTLVLAATDDELREELVGPWGQDAECAEGSLTFKANGTFAVVRPDDDPENGYWSLMDGVLTATDMPTSTVTIAGNTLSLGDPKGGSRLEQFTRCP